MRLVNQHSYVFAGLLVLALSWLLLRRVTSPKRRIALGLVVVVIIGAAAMLRTGAGDVRAATDLDRALASGKPVALEFYSNF